MSGIQSIGSARIAGALMLILACVAFAGEAPPAPDPMDAAWKAAGEALQRGPAVIQLRNQARIELPEKYGFVPAKEGTALMNAMGNETGENFLGLIFPAARAGWFVTVDFDPAGYIKDDEATHWDADELLKNLKDGTEEGNKHRQKMGIPDVEVTRWVEKPVYDGTTHRLVWSAEIREKGGHDPDPGVNYNTYVLGREGYISLDLVTSAASVEADKPAARELLGAVSFNDGKRYTDFNSSTDKVAAYGIAALVGGLAAKKLGLLAAAGVFLVKFAKIIFVALAAAGGSFAKFFKRKAAPSPE